MPTLFLNGIASDYTHEGPSTIRLVTIVTNRSEALSKALLSGLGRGLSQWQITGGFTGEARTMLMCAVHRPQIEDLKRILPKSILLRLLLSEKRIKPWDQTLFDTQGDRINGGLHVCAELNSGIEAEISQAESS